MGTGVKFGFVGEGLVVAEQGGPQGSGGAGQGSRSRTPAPDPYLLEIAQSSWAGANSPLNAPGERFPFLLPHSHPWEPAPHPDGCRRGQERDVLVALGSCYKIYEAKTNEQ